jgi:hypothetical protein
MASSTQLNRNPSEVAEESKRRLNREKQGAGKSKEFHEAPGESEANAVRDAFLNGARPNPARLGEALATADPATVARVVSRLQEENGNTYVQRTVAAWVDAGNFGPDVAVQREPAAAPAAEAVATETPDQPAAGAESLFSGPDPLALIFATVVASNIAAAAPTTIDPKWQAKVAEYMHDNPSDGTILQKGIDRKPSYFKGGWILDVQQGAEAITLDQAVFHRGQLTIETYVHEMVHVGQYGELGITGFLVSYFGNRSM